eukprot:TRINITY_DN10865_c0_g1_i1.p1 TRINITY_DN10865_c0_g1~~TRINITY_DN10865_c0_g1_i1.p1  ORF type:complete len:459 (+),score=45.30 TRINITY_DN10865_c0_g1_i1:103-1479(+)
MATEGPTLVDLSNDAVVSLAALTADGIAYLCDEDLGPHELGYNTQVITSKYCDRRAHIRLGRPGDAHNWRYLKSVGQYKLSPKNGSEENTSLIFRYQPYGEWEKVKMVVAAEENNLATAVYLQLQLPYKQVKYIVPGNRVGEPCCISSTAVAWQMRLVQPPIIDAWRLWDVRATPAAFPDGIIRQIARALIDVGCFYVSRVRNEDKDWMVRRTLFDVLASRCYSDCQSVWQHKSEPQLCDNGQANTKFDQEWLNRLQHEGASLGKDIAEWHGSMTTLAETLLDAIAKAECWLTGSGKTSWADDFRHNKKTGDKFIHYPPCVQDDVPTKPHRDSSYVTIMEQCGTRGLQIAFPRRSHASYAVKKPDVTSQATDATLRKPEASDVAPYWVDVPSPSSGELLVNIGVELEFLSKVFKGVPHRVVRRSPECARHRFSMPFFYSPATPKCMGGVAGCDPSTIP